MDKKCFKCGETKPLAEFYRHSKMGDGHLNKCKKCTKNDVQVNYEKNSKSDKFMEKERARGREKYHRLGYKEIQYKHNEKRPWTKFYEYKNLNRALRVRGLLKKGEVAHHWSYLKDNIKDVFIMDRSSHRRLHNQLIFDDEKMFFKSKNGDELCSKDKHLEYIYHCGLGLIDDVKI